MKTYSLRLIVLSMGFVLIGCNTGGDVTPGLGPSPESPTTSPVFDSTVFSDTHKLVYVPTYSHIYTQDGGREFDLAVTLSIRNTDPDKPITISSVTYSNSAGQLVRGYVEAPIILAPLASRPFVVDESDRTGGVGANFIVEWRSMEVVSEPVIEAVMISTKSTQGISFVSRGVVVRPIASGN